MPQLHKIMERLGGIRAHRRLIAVWLGSFSALATVLAVGAFATGGSTLDAGSATPPPHPLDSSDPCTWYVLPNVSDASRTVLEVGPTPPPPNTVERVTDLVDKANTLKENVEAVVNPEAETVEQLVLRMGVESLSTAPSTTSSTQSPPSSPTPTNPVPTPNADPIVNAPPATNPYTGTTS